MKLKLLRGRFKMVAFASIWLILGAGIVMVMTIFSLLKKIKWKSTGIATLIYVFVLTILVITVKPTNDGTTYSANPKSSKTVKKNSVKFDILSKKDKDTDNYITDKNGNFNLKIKSLGNGKIYVKDGDPNFDYNDEFKTVTLDVKKGDVKSVPLSLNVKDPTREYTIKSSTGYKKHIEVYNFSDAYSASESAAESSKNINQSYHGSSYQDSLNTRKDNWNSSSDGDTIKVKKVSQELHTTIVTVNETDWESLSTVDKISFLEDWNDSVKRLYSMSDRNGTTSIQVVNSNNKYNILGHCTPTGKPKIDD